MKFTINNNLRLLTCPLLLAGAVCCSSGNDGDTPAPGPGPDPSPVTGDVLAYVTSADGNRLFTEEGLDYSKVSMSPYRVTIDPSTTYQTVDGFGPAITGATCYNLLQMSQADRTAILRSASTPRPEPVSALSACISAARTSRWTNTPAATGRASNSSPFPPWRRMASFRC